jgi:hypothetical protein
MIDWKDPTREDVLHFLMVDPHNLDIIRGELKNVILEDSSLTEGYFTDTRKSGKLTFLKENYIANSWIRVVHEVPAANYRNELGTFVAVSPGGTTAQGADKQTFDLHSMLWTMEEDRCPNHFAIGEGAYALDAFDRICDNCGRPYVHSAGVNNYRYTSSKIYEMGDPFLSDLLDICETSRNRLDVDGHGRITISKYVSPRYITATWDLNYDDPRSMIKSEGIETSSSDYDTPNRSIVVYQNDNVEIYAYADAPSSYIFSSAQRGYVMAAVQNISDLSPATKIHAQAVASQMLEEGMTGVTQYKLETMYFPGHEGETVNLTFDGETHHCLIQYIDPINLHDMTMQLTLREA